MRVFEMYLSSLFHVSFFMVVIEKVQSSLELPYLLVSEDERCRVGPLRFFPTVNAAVAAKAVREL